MRLLVTLTAAALLSYSAAAVDKSQKKPEQRSPVRETSAAAKDPNAGRPKPSAEMKRLAKMIGGRWQVDEKYHVTPVTPQGGEGKGMDAIHRGPGGLSMILNYSSVGTMGEYHGAGIITWSPEENAYKQFWVDDGTPGGEVWTGNWEGDSLVFATSRKMGDQQTSWKQTLSGFTPEGFTTTFDMWQGDALTPCKTFKFTRTAKQTARIQKHGTGMHGRPNPDGGWGPRAETVLKPSPRS